jgi:exopolysaccharide biosynthesis protein
MSKIEKNLILSVVIAMVIVVLAICGIAYTVSYGKEIDSYFTNLATKCIKYPFTSFTIITVIVGLGIFFRQGINNKIYE